MNENNKLGEFLDSVCAKVKYKGIHADIRAELTGHVQELAEAYAEKAQSQDDALDMAITAMGNCEEIGTKLNRQHRPQTEWSLVALTAVIALLGGVVMYMSSHSAANFDVQTAADFNKFLLCAVLGIAVMVGIYFFDYTKLKKIALPIYIVSVALLVYSLADGRSVNGLYRWISIGGYNISTSFISLPLLVALAGFIDQFRGKGMRALFALMALAAVPCFLIMNQPHFSEAFIFAAVCFILFVVASGKKHFGESRKPFITLWLSAVVLLIAFLFYFVLSRAYMQARIRVWLDFASDATGAGYQQYMAQSWLAASNWFGTTAETVKGYGIFQSLPAATTDFAFVTVIFSLGWAAGVALILAVTAYIARMLITLRKSKTAFGFYLSLGACALLGFQFIIGILVNLNLMPTVSVYIPFISFGGVGYITGMAAIGLVLSVWRRNNILSTVHIK